MSKMALIVYAHQSDSSFNAAAKKKAEEVLSRQYTVIVSDLYALKFKATATAEDIAGGVKNPEKFDYAKELSLAWEEDRLAKDIKDELDKLNKADLVIFQFPLYWSSVPAIMKGWMDRVLGFAHLQEKKYGEGIFKDKKAMLSLTTDCPASMYSAFGINGDINLILWSLQKGILNYCGFQVLEPQIFWDPAHADEDACKSMLDKWSERLEHISEGKLLKFCPVDYFDKEDGFKLKLEIREEYAGQKYGPSLGVHMDKPLKPDGQVKVDGQIKAGV